ncbi:hypothetical protein L484_002465 [Morus notabilis]|uniref:Uncharacterized protein n=1 Tax=Morus notabilis TaxID=981085 RepID=W9SET3_9ROSA|nr:hypothetical protein L484_002465 [Morus notabilis]
MEYKVEKCQEFDRHKFLDGKMLITAISFHWVLGELGHRRETVQICFGIFFSDCFQKHTDETSNFPVHDPKSTMKTIEEN